MYKRNERLIHIKIRQYLFPGIMMALALQLGNIVDVIMVGNILGTEAMEAIGLCLPTDALIQLPGYCLGCGGAIAAGIMLGRREREKASRLFTLTLTVTVIAGLVVAAAAFFAAYPLAGLLSGGGSLSKQTGDYLFVSMLGAPVIGTGLLMVQYLGVESHPELASAYIIVSNIINLTMDYALLKYTPLNTAGAALSTIIGFALGFGVLILYARSPKRMLRLTAPPPLHELREAVIAGLPTFVYMTMTFVKRLGMNLIILRLLGAGGIASFTVCDNVLVIIEMLSGGIVGIIPNMAGILYGEEDYFGIRVLCKKTLLYSYGVVAACFAVIFVFSGQFVSVFGIQDALLHREIAAALRIFVFCLPAYQWNKFLTSYYESIEQTAHANLVTACQNCLYVLPCALAGILIGKTLGDLGMDGLAAGFVAAELLTALTAFLYRRFQSGDSDVFLLPDAGDEPNFDATISANIMEAEKLSAELEAFCQSQKVDRIKANLAAVALEEMAVNIIKYGGKSSQWIDVNVAVKTEGLRIRIRDNGVPFDPTAYENDGEEFAIHGIELVKKAATRISYIRAVDMNNTVIEFT